MGSRARSLIKAVRPVEFRVTLDAELSAQLDRRSIEARVQARDLSGIALAEAPAVWTVARATSSVLPARLLEDAAFSYAASDDETEEAIEDDDEWPFPLDRASSLDAKGDHRSASCCRTACAAGALHRDGAGARHLVADPGRAGRRRGARRRVPRNRARFASADGTVPTPAIRLVARTPAGEDVPGIAVTVRVFRGGEDDKNPVVLHTTTGTSPVRVPLPAALEGREILVIARPDDTRLAIMPSRVSGRVTTQSPRRPRPRRTRRSCRSIARATGPGIARA